VCGRRIHIFFTFTHVEFYFILLGKLICHNFFAEGIFFKRSTHQKVCAVVQDVVNVALSKLLPLSSSVTAPTFQFCPLLNVSYCTATETNSEVVR